MSELTILVGILVGLFALFMLLMRGLSIYASLFILALSVLACGELISMVTDYIPFIPHIQIKWSGWDPWATLAIIMASIPITIISIFVLEDIEPEVREEGGHGLSRAQQQAELEKMSDMARREREKNQPGTM